MKKFRFRLQKVLDVRRVKERQQQERLHNAIRQRQTEEKRLGVLEKEISDIVRVMRENQKTAFEVWSYSADAQYRARVEQAKDAQRGRADDSMQHEEAERTAFVGARRRTHVLEKLRELRHKDWEREASREEDKHLDEIATHANNLRKSAR
jgi:flagellar FliJ protein